jgi:dynein heavy chain 2
VQLYKVLEMQFINGLEDTSQVIPEINVDIVLKNKEIMLKPSIEELKDKYYKEIMNYLLWPGRVFKGINGNL